MQFKQDFRPCSLQTHALTFVPGHEVSPISVSSALSSLRKKMVRLTK